MPAVFEHEDRHGDRLTVVPAAGGLTLHVQDARPGFLLAAVHLDEDALTAFVTAIHNARGGEHQ